MIGTNIKTIRGKRHKLVNDWLQIDAKEIFMDLEKTKSIFSRATHGRCAEPVNISMILFEAEKILKLKANTITLNQAKEIFKNSYSKATRIHNSSKSKLAHGLHKDTCPSCNPLLEHFGITEIK